MVKLCQIIAVCNGKKARAQKAVTEVYHKLQKPALLQGISRNYRPKDEEGERLPSESKRVQYRVSDAIKEVSEVLADLFDTVATQDYANTKAAADVVVDGKVLIRQVPVTHLLFLEKQLTDLHTLVDKLPTLDPGEEWSYSPEADSWATAQHETTRTKKVPRNHVKYEATKEHPAQVEVYTEDVVVGTWSTVNFSGAVPEKQKNEALERIRKLQDAVKVAREEANSHEVEERKAAKSVFEYAFEPLLNGNSASSV